jgi:hypothetical protein
MAVGFFWAIFAGWDDLPTAVAVPFGVGCVTLIVLSLRDLAGRYSRR